MCVDTGAGRAPTRTATPTPDDTEPAVAPPRSERLDPRSGPAVAGPPLTVRDAADERRSSTECGGSGAGSVRGGGRGRRSRGSDGTRATVTTTSTTTRTPPTTGGTHVAVSVASVPANIWPSRGPPVTTTVKTPWVRPRRWSGTAACRIDWRKIALMLSDPPATARHRAARASAHRLTSPKSIDATACPPSSVTASTTPKPRMARP